MILCTFPGKFGDLLWALPTIRALSRRIGEPVDLLISHDMRSIGGLVKAQPYIGQVLVESRWIDTDCLPVQRRLPPANHIGEQLGGYDQVYHLGYRDWPARPLPFETLDCLNAQYAVITYAGEYASAPTHVMDAELHLEEPWITQGQVRLGFTTFPAPRRSDDARLAVGFSDEHFELKFGLTKLLEEHDIGWHIVVVGNSPRWNEEAGTGAMTWHETLYTLQDADIFLGCCSALHVLAVAAGVPVVLMEPSEARWNPIFYPLGTTSPQVTLVLGTDGRPTFDARHCIDALTSTLARRSHHVDRHRET